MRAGPLHGIVIPKRTFSYRRRLFAKFNTISQSWEVQETGFWNDTPYIALTNGYHYPEAKVLANHHIVISEDNKADTYIFWSHYYDEDDLVKIMKSKGFKNIKAYGNVLPESDDFWNGENVTFYISRK